MSDVQRPYDPPSRSGDLIYGALYSAAIGGSVVALGFLVVDLVAARPLFTPSLLGSVLFFSADAATFTGVDLTAVALFSVVHFVAFGVLGAVGSWVYRSVFSRGKEAVLPAGAAIFVVGEAGFLLASTTVMPGVADRIGHALVLGTNALAAAVMAAFLAWAYRQNSRPVEAEGNVGDGRRMHTM